MPTVLPSTPLGPTGLFLPTIAPAILPGEKVFHGGTTNGSTSWARGGHASQLMELCRSAESAGAGALWAVDHLFWSGPVVDPFVALALAAASTHRAVIGTAVLQLPLRQPAVVAKQAASLQQVSGGRLVLGLGVGSHRGEYDAVGCDFATRGARLDRGLNMLRSCWEPRGPSSAPDGPGASTSYHQLPAPGPVPVFFGGSSAAAIRRTAAVGDGWLPMFLSPAAYGERLAVLRSELAAVGRTADAVLPAVVVMVSTGPDASVARQRAADWLGALYGLPARAFARHVVAGPVDHVADALDAYRDAGAAHVAVMVADEDPLAHATDLLRAASSRTAEASSSPTLSTVP